MRLFSLIRIAWEAEGLRLKLLVRRQVMRIVWAGVAGVFALFLLGMAHVAAYEFIAIALPRGWAALVVAGADLLLLIVFGAIAASGRAGHEEREARRISRQARLELTDAGRTFAVITPMVRAAGGSRKTGALLGAALSSLIRKRK